MPFVPAISKPPAGPRRGGRVFVAVALVFLATPAVFTTPGAVNAAAYLFGAGRHDTFTGYAYSKQCNGSNCATTTRGTLGSTGQDVTWPGRLPLARSAPVRDPVWAFPSFRFVAGVPDALVQIGLGLFFDALFGLVAFASLIRKAAARAGRPRIPGPAEPFPSGAR